MSGYESPFNSRYGSADMRNLFSQQRKHRLWRSLWMALATGERILGIGISNEQLREMADHSTDVHMDRVMEIERETHHDVMAHLRVYAEQCPLAAPIIHLGATSAYIVDNTDARIIKDATSIIITRVSMLMATMVSLAYMYKNTPTLAYTHFQSAQPTTFGKRVCMWLQDLEGDRDRLVFESKRIRSLGCKGATGTCASFMELFDGDYTKVKKLDKYVAQWIGVESAEVSGQTYSRKNDYYLFSALSGVAQTLSKIANDLRLMSGRGEFYEPFGKKQVGSSAMAYKQNPIQCEKVVSLARLVVNNTTVMAETASNQWLERSLDDSAARRVVIPETFMALDEMLLTMKRVLTDCTVCEDTMMANVSRETPKLVSEGVLMLAVKRGGDRQELHEAMRQLLVLDHRDFVHAVSDDPRFNITADEVLDLTNVSKLVGAAPTQVEEFLGKYTKKGEKNGESDEMSI